MSIYGVNTWAMSTYESRRGLARNYITPVSYTHLDVYKRQDGGVPPSGGIARNAWTQGKELDGFDDVPPLPRQ